jgi:hypothetical protein
LQRLEVTRIGNFYCHVQVCAPDSADYDHYSTPSRDARFRETQLRFLEILARVPAEAPLRSYLEEVAQIPIAGDFVAWDYMINRDGLSERMSADPTQSFFARWALPDLAPLPKALTNLRNWAQGWFHRDGKVAAAHLLCRADGDSAELSCDPEAVEVRALATTRLDGSLRSARSSFREEAYRLPAAERDRLRDEASWPLPAGPFCGPQANDTCTLEDLLLSRSQLVERMSSDPTARLRERYGAR